MTIEKLAEILCEADGRYWDDSSTVIKDCYQFQARGILENYDVVPKGQEQEWQRWLNNDR